MEEESSMSVRDAVDRLERSLSVEQSTSSQSSAGDFSIPGYLRTTASSNRKLNNKRKTFQSSNNHEKRRRTQNTNSIVPTKNYDGRVYEHQESRESSVFSIASSTRDDPIDDEDGSEEQFEKLCLYAKYLQWEFLNQKTKIAFEHKKQAIERELSLAMEAVKEKRKREATLFKEKNEMLDDRDVRKYIQQAQKVVNKIKQKLAVQDCDFVQEKKEMSVILENMNDLNIPMSSVHENIKELIRTRDLMKSIIQSP
ncbi:hypothetical protein INT46_010964 [Mucor plumbeus]|uniref:Uncharacterized protein n=1 Tax=Mucor plumbeus TaxID=97098 RepID=A0A8H7QDC9_9FUNG|nr:hypothetical protein INT46_010964 [Mucor plumbeus]